ncbi:MBL fold metallo-hydrolase [Eubacterium xylanophilum]|uniref:MBL fold metallo-hydrolase n=1 Tax=Eubacterium xylanophilum TaxID=39497 RepID=UPI00047B9763|nr:MBL fold metallo-hydrolase [Eubacterium xylanophilum]
MKIINLIENTDGPSGCVSAHGLSFFIETKKHKLLVDLGPTEATLENARKLGIDLAEVDTVILSHGHYDHSGGIMPFSKINSEANIYMQRLSLEEHYSDDGDESCHRYRYNGIDKAIADLPQLQLLDGNHDIDEELSLFTIGNRTHKLPFANSRLLVKRGGEYIPDDFSHEQFLVMKSEKGNVLISGCAHNGILSIMDEYRKLFHGDPHMVISGFHLMKKTDYNEDEINEISEIAYELRKYSAQFVTCHCTGIEAYEIMKTIMGDQLSYVHSGDEVYI